MYQIFEALLHERGITPYKVSKDTGVTQTALSNWKRGKSTPNAKNLQKIADYLDVSIDYLMSGTNDNSNTTLLNDEKINSIARSLMCNPNLMSLFEDAKGADTDDIETIHTVLLALKHKEEKLKA